MLQNSCIGIIFISALVYLGWLIKKQFTAKNSCAKGCGCSAVDLEKIEKELMHSAKK